MRDKQIFISFRYTDIRRFGSVKWKTISILNFSKISRLLRKKGKNNSNPIQRLQCFEEKKKKKKRKRTRNLKLSSKVSVYLF